jgi:transcriptional regulator with XRE-family HTH domain
MARPTLKGPELSARLRAVRRERGVTLEALAGKTGITKGFLSQVERGMKAPSISTLMRIAQVLGVTVAELFEDSPKKKAARYSLVRASERQRYAREGSVYGYQYEALAFRKGSKKMEPFIVFPPLRMPHDLFRHDGDEMMLVLSGRIQVELAGELLDLKPGDCVYFDAATPHRSRSVGKRMARAVVVVSALSG